MEDKHDEGISFPQHGFYSVQDESNRRYSRTGKHQILAQKQDAILMKYRYSDETEKSSPYSRTQSDFDFESPDPSDSPNSYQGVYSPQLAQSNGHFEDSPWYSSRGPRRSWINDEPASKWISPGLQRSISDPLENNQPFEHDNVGLENQWPTEDTLSQRETEIILEIEPRPYQRTTDVDVSGQWQTRDHSHSDKARSLHEIEPRPYQRMNDDTSDNQFRREPPPPYSLAVRSTKRPAPKTYLDIAPHLTNNLQGIEDIDRLLEDLEGSEPDPELLYRHSDLAKPGDEAKVEIIQKPDVSAWAELVHIDQSSEDEKPKRPSSGIIITEHRERRPSSPDRHIRFVLEEANRAKRNPEDLTRASQHINGMGLESRQLKENHPYDAKVFGERQYQGYEEETVGLTPLVDEVFRYPSTSDNYAHASEQSQPTAYGVDNPGYDYIEDYDHTAVDHHRPKQKPISSDIVRRRVIDWYGKGNVYDSSQSSTLDSVFTERSWSSEVGRPRAFREKRRVYPKPKDPVGDLGDGLQMKTGRKVVETERDDSHQGITSTSRNPTHEDERGHRRRHGEASRGEHSNQEDLRKTLIKRELELFMERNSSNGNLPPTRRQLESYESRGPSTGYNHNSRSGNKVMSARPNRLQHTTYRSGKYPMSSQMHMHANPMPDHSRNKPRAFSAEGIDRTVQLRNPGLGRKTDRPQTYPNDINKPFSRLMSQDDNNVKSGDFITVAPGEDRHSSQRLQHSHQTRNSVPLNHPHRPERGMNRRAHEQRHRPSQAFRRPRNEDESQSFPQETQRHTRRREPTQSGHVHQSGIPSKEEHPKHDRRHQRSSNERQTSDKNEWASPTIAAVSEVPHRLYNPQSESNEKRSRAENEWASPPTIADISGVPQRPHDPETTPISNQQGQQGGQTPAGGHKSGKGAFTNWRFFSVMAAIWFFPIGIWALRKSHQVDSRVAAKDIPGARRAARSARNHSIAAFVVLGFIVLMLVSRLIEITVDPRKTFIQNYKIVPDEVDVICC